MQRRAGWRHRAVQRPGRECAGGAASGHRRAGRLDDHAADHSLVPLHLRRPRLARQQRQPRLPQAAWAEGALGEAVCILCGQSHEGGRVSGPAGAGRRGHHGPYRRGIPIHTGERVATPVPCCMLEATCPRSWRWWHRSPPSCWRGTARTASPAGRSRGRSPASSSASSPSRPTSGTRYGGGGGGTAGTIAGLHCSYGR